MKKVHTVGSTVVTVNMKYVTQLEISVFDDAEVQIESLGPYRMCVKLIFVM